MNQEIITKEIATIIRRYLSPHQYQIFLFGSWAKKMAQATSDIDIAILGDEAVEDGILARIKNDIAGIPTLRSIDVVDLKKTDEKFRQEVLTHAKVL